jgi:hypothetical protein
MGWLLASGNQLVWIRPSFQNIEQHQRDALKKAMQGGQHTAAWGDENQPVDSASWFSIAYDPDNRFWLARHQPKICKGFLGAVTGTAQPLDSVGGDLALYSSGYKTGSVPALVLQDYKYASEATAKWGGSGVRAERYNADEKVVGYTLRTRFVRQLDASLMTPDERLCEMIEVAINDPNFSSEMKAQFGVLADPKVMFATAGILGLFIGIGAGAEVLGGAAFAAAVRSLLGISMQLTMIVPYVKAFSELQRCCLSASQDDFFKGSHTVQDILAMTVRDIAMLVTMEGAMRLGSKAIGVLKNLFLKYGPEDWVQAARKYKGMAEHKVAQVRAAKYGYVGEQLLKIVPDPAAIFLKGESNFFLSRAAREQEMIVIRGPSVDRMAWLEKLQGWLDGKAEWIKAKSWHGWHGLLCIPKVPEVTAALTKPKPPYDLRNLKGVFKEVDDFVAGRFNCPAYEIPFGLDLHYNYQGTDYKAFDWKAAGVNHADAQGYRLVDIGDRYLIVDSLGRPICQDLDLGAIQRIGTPVGDKPGSHLESGLKGKNRQTGVQENNHEDNYAAQEMMNIKMSDQTGYMYSAIKHGGAGGSARHHAMGGGWSARNTIKDWNETLYVFLPVFGAGKTARLFKMDGWGEMEKFWNANQELFGSPFPFPEKAAAAH